MLKRIIVCLLILTMMMGAVHAEGEMGSAQAAVAIDSMSGTILMGRNYNIPMGMASTTKIMTGILALEHGRLTDVVTIHPSASGIEGSSIYLNPNEKVTLETLVYGLLLKSGNDAAVAIAQHISGSEAEFVKLMNNKAAELGLTNTHFENPHGLYADTHYTTAYELALIFRYCMQNPDFVKPVIRSNQPWQTVQIRLILPSAICCDRLLTPLKAIYQGVLAQTSSISLKLSFSLTKIKSYHFPLILNFQEIY